MVPFCTSITIREEGKGREGRKEGGRDGRKEDGSEGVCNKVRTEGRKREGAGKDGR